MLPIDPELLTCFGIEEPSILDAEPDQLSVGQQQKIALALALSVNADLYVLDEPLANLDGASREKAMREIQKRTTGRMLVMIMHNAEEYIQSFDSVCHLGGPGDEVASGLKINKEDSAAISLSNTRDMGRTPIHKIV
jgi:ATP-binding cassette subfamily B protein